MSTISGECLCGAITFNIKDNFLYAGYCHCSRCRKASGAAGTAIGGLAAIDFELTKGAEYIQQYTRSENSVTCFCKQCGSTLYGEKPQSGLLHIRYGALNQTPSLPVQAHTQVASKADWYEINDQLPQFAEAPPGA